ncbi:MAG: hypothetical protein AB1586_03430 [Pseudomonadota bacterium]
MAEPVEVIDLQAWRARAQAPAPGAPEPVHRAEALGPLSAASFALPMAFFAFWPAFVSTEAAQWLQRDAPPRK